MGIVCGILVGGLSRRMGRPKALIALDGATFLERTVSIAKSVISDVVLLGRPTFELPVGLKTLPIIEDDPAGRGPMGGLGGFLRSKPADDCLLLACDMPALDSVILRRLINCVVDSADAVVPREDGVDGGVHPCCALYRSSIAPAVFDAIAARRYAMQDLLGRVRVRWMPLTGSEAAWLENVNTSADLERRDVTRPNVSAKRPNSEQAPEKMR